MSAVPTALAKEALRRAEQAEAIASTALQALKSAEDLIKALEQKRGPGRPPNEPRRSD